MRKETKRKNQKDDLVCVRLASSRSANLFFQPLPRLKLNTTIVCNKTAKLTTTDGKII